jgi:hypothetical protein
MSGQAIYESFAKSDPRVLDEGASAALRVLTNYATRTADLSRLATIMERGWQGEAAGAARRGAGPVEVGHVTAMPQINNAVISMNAQFIAFSAAKNAVTPVPSMPARPGFFDNMFSLGGAGRHYEQQVAAVQHANDNNIAVMTQYENATRANQAVLTGIPAALPPIVEPTVPEPPAPPGPVPPGGPGRRIPPSGGGGRPGTGSTGGGSTAGGGTGDGGTGGTPTASSPRPTDTAGLLQTRPEFARTSPSGVPVPDAGLPKPAPSPSFDGPRSGPSFGPVGAGYGSGADSTRGGAPGFGGPRGAGGMAEPGARGGGPGGIGARGPAGMEVGRGAAGRAGTPGTAGPAGGRRGADDEDYEHRRPAFLVEADPDELFGNDEAAAPPVIGG